VTPGPKQLRRALLIACVLFVALSGTASAASPCWKRLLNDWYDGHIDKVYPIPCYHQAIAHLPADVQVYSSARDDIQRALQRAIADKQSPAQSVPTTSTTSTTGATSATTTTTAKVTTTPTGTTRTTTTATDVVTNPTPTNGRKKGKGIAHALDKLNPGSADSFPLPLLILGALAILLVLAGIGGMIWRRYQGGPPGAPPAAP
jgi:cobalamin biosynthesis Mg chelatase CobN